MNQSKWHYWILGAILSLVVAAGAEAAYDHGGADTDSAKFLDVYPDKAGTKLDSCALCHSGGTYVNSKGRSVTLGSCQRQAAFGFMLLTAFPRTIPLKRIRSYTKLSVHTRRRLSITTKKRTRV